MPSSDRSMRGKASLEVRRSRGEISCAECRRHKLKCDKSIPCSSCVRKECQSICPNGTLTPSHGSRPGAADTDAFKQKISTMGKRIRQLEDALQISHSSISTSQHPLLAEDLLEIKSGTVPPAPPDKEDDVADVELLHHFGTLAVTDKGTEMYIGGADALLVRHLNLPDVHPNLDPGLTFPVPVSYLSKTFPFSPLYLPEQEIQTYIEEKLPSYLRASALVEAYLENLSWFLRLVDREQIMEELIPDIYRRRRRRQTPAPDSPDSSDTSLSSAPPPTHPHALALLLAVFACGAVADLTLPPWNDEADLYYHLARTAISLKPVFEGAGLHAVQAIALIGAYDIFSCRKGELEGPWKIMTFAVSLAASIGLNRDPAHFKLSPKLVQRRRQVFWELYTIDVWKSIGSGRPVMFTPSVVDCGFPEDLDADLCGDGGEVGDSIWRLRYRFTKEILIEVVGKLGTIHAVKYSEILALDQKIREFDPRQPVCGCPRTYDCNGMNLLCHVQIGWMKDIALILIHRNFFARALVEAPDNPMRSQFAPSFLSTYRSATTLLRVVRCQFEYNAHCLIRLWPILAHSLHAAVMLGSIAACGSESALAPQAYTEFSLAVDMFQKAQIHPYVKSGLTILLTLREQAQQALSRHGYVIASQDFSGSAIRSGSRNENEDLNSARRMHSGGFKGGSVPAPLQQFNILRDSDMAAKPSSSQSSPLMSDTTPVTSPKEGLISIGLETMPEQNWSANETSVAQNRRSSSSYQRADHSSNSSSLNSDTATASTITSLESPHGRAPPVSHSPSHVSQGSLVMIQLEEREANVFDGPSLMQVEHAPYNPMDFTSTSVRNGSTNDQLSDPQPASIASHGGLDVFNAFTTFSEMAVDSGTASPSPSSLSTYPTMQMQMQSPLNAQPQPSFAPVYDGLSGLSPRMVFNSDFDVSFNMRASTGEENVLPLLPEDMEAWRNFLQDSRFFGIVDGVLDGASASESRL